MSASEAVPSPVVGTFHPPASARAIPARLIAKDGNPAIEIDDAPSRPVDPAAVTVSHRIAGVPRRIEFADGAAFVTRDDDGLEAALGGRARSGLFSTIARLERPSLRLFVFGSLAVIAIVAGLRWGIPAAAGFLAWATPQPVGEEIGAATLASLDRLLFAPSKLAEDERERTRADFERIAESAGLSHRVSLHFREGGAIGPNAFALPGGVLVVTDELIDLAKAPEEVAGVIAHEIGHAELRHPEQALWRTLGVGVGLTVVFGDAGTLAEEIAAVGQLLVELSYSRAQESEADARAVELMTIAGMAPGHFVVALDRLHGICGKACEQTGWLSSHPGGVDRRAALCAAIPEPGPAAAICAKARPGE